MPNSVPSRSKSICTCAMGSERGEGTSSVIACERHGRRDMGIEGKFFCIHCGQRLSHSPVSSWWCCEVHGNVLSEEATTTRMRVPGDKGTTEGVVGRLTYCDAHGPYPSNKVCPDCFWEVEIRCAPEDVEQWKTLLADLGGDSPERLDESSVAMAMIALGVQAGEALVANRRRERAKPPAVGRHIHDARQSHFG